MSFTLPDDFDFISIARTGDRWQGSVRRNGSDGYQIFFETTAQATLEAMFKRTELDDYEDLLDDDDDCEDLM